MSNVLDRIVTKKWEEIAAAKARVSEQTLRDRITTAPPVRDFLASIQARHPMGLIAEVKKASPSAGLIRADFDPVAIAKCYEANGAACISVLTDEHFFQGHLNYLESVRAAVSIPVLRKDFIIDPYQVLEARASGADCILLIAECLTDSQMSELSELAQSLGMQVLTEVYDPENVERVLKLGAPLIGVNNRDLRSFKTDLMHTVRLREQIPADILVVGESGINTREHVLTLQNAGVHSILVGESLMRSPDIAPRVQELLGLNLKH